MQDQEVGDGTTSVVIFAAELLQKAHGLVRTRIHPTSIISGYRLAMREVSYLMCKLLHYLDTLTVPIQSQTVLPLGQPPICIEDVMIFNL